MAVKSALTDILQQIGIQHAISAAKSGIQVVLALTIKSASSRKKRDKVLREIDAMIQDFLAAQEAGDEAEIAKIQRR